MTATAALASLELRREDFRLAVASLVPLIKRPTPVPILQTVLWDGSSVAATDLEVFLHRKVRVDPSLDAAGYPALCLPGARLAEILTVTTSESIVIEWDEAGARIKAGKDRFKLNGVPASEFPRMLETSPALAVIPAQNLRDALQGVSYATERSEAYRALQGVHLVARDGQLVAEATDRKVLAVRPIGTLVDLNWIIPNPAIDRLISLLEKSEEVVNVSIAGTWASFASRDWSLSVRLIDQQFPNTAEFLKAPEGLTIMLDPAEWLSAVKRAKVLADDNRALEVKLEAGTATLSGVSPDAGESMVKAEYRSESPDAFLFRVSGTYLQETLAQFNGAVTVTLSKQSGGAVKPLHFSDQKGNRALIVPLVS